MDSITYKEDIDAETSPWTTLGYTYDSYGRLQNVTKDSATVRSYVYESGGLQLDYMTDYLEFETSGTNQMRTDYTYNWSAKCDKIL